MQAINLKKAFTYERLENAVRFFGKNYPFLKVFSIGKSVLMRDIFCFSFGIGNVKVFLNGAHHANEWITAMMLCQLTDDFCRYFKHKKSKKHREILKLWQNYTFYICPMVNPDGVNLSILGMSCDIPEKIRKSLLVYNENSADFCGKWQANIRGVDLNHNYDAGFSEGKKHEKKLGIFSPGKTRFSGMYPESEPETKAVADFTRKIMPDIAIAYHTQGEEIYYSYLDKTPKASEKIAQKMSALSGYALSSPKGIASFSGYKDWAIDALSIPAFTIEAGFGENPLPLYMFCDIYKTNKNMLLGLFTDYLQFSH